MKTELNTKNKDIALVWRELAEELMERSKKFGADDLINELETTASHSFQLSERHPVDVANLPDFLDRLYSERVGQSSSK